MLDVRAQAIADTLAIAAVRELVRSAERRGNHTDAILPTIDDWKVAAAVAAATGVQAQTDGVAHLSLSRDDLYG